MAFQTFTSWYWHAQQQGRVEKNSARAIRRWRNRTFAAVFSRWLRVCQVSRHASSLQIMSILRSRNRGLWLAFDGLRTKALQQRYMRGRAAQMIRRWQHASLLGGWHKWVDGAKHFSRMRHTVDRITRRLINAVLANAFLGWYVNACSQRRDAQLATRIITRWQQTHLARAWDKWLKDARHFRRVQNVLKKAARLLLNAALSKVANF